MCSCNNKENGTTTEFKMKEVKMDNQNLLKNSINSEDFDFTRSKAKKINHTKEEILEHYRLLNLIKRIQRFYINFKKRNSYEVDSMVR
jgi:hypothetical protein